MYSVEHKNFGMNSSTYWAIGAFAITFVQAFGLYYLAHSIHRNKCAKGVSFSMLGYSHAMMWSFAYYAWITHSVVMLFNGIFLATLYAIAIIVAMHHCHVARNKRKSILYPLCVLPLLLIIVQEKDLLILLLMVIGLCFFFAQAQLLYCEKKVGSYDPRFTVATIFASIFWFFFALSIENIALTVINPLMFIISAATLCTYFRARRYEKLHSAL